MRGFFNGFVFAVALMAGAALAAVLGGLVPAGADVTPPGAEKWAAKTSLRTTIERDTRSLRNPIAASDDALIAGVKSYGANCAICHGAADGKMSTLAKGFYIKAPQLAKRGVEDDPEATTFWKLEHGIRFTRCRRSAATSRATSFGRSRSFSNTWTRCRRPPIPCGKCYRASFPQSKDGTTSTRLASSQTTTHAPSEIARSAPHMGSSAAMPLRTCSSRQTSATVACTAAR